jgi:hypothetical protein
MPIGSRLRVSFSHQIAPGDRKTEEVPMNARAKLITAALTLSLILPVASGAGVRTVPWEPTPPKSHNHLQLLGATSSRTAADPATYNPSAYVYGGASQKVAQAITVKGRAAKTPTANVCPNDSKYRVPC